MVCPGVALAKSVQQPNQDKKWLRGAPTGKLA